MWYCHMSPGVDIPCISCGVSNLVYVDISCISCVCGVSNLVYFCQFDCDFEHSC